MELITNNLGKFFGVAIRGQSYLNILYLFLSFPLGLFYFIFLVTGLSLSLGLVIVWVGLLLLLLVFAAWYGFIIFERQMAVSMLHEDIPPITRESYANKTALQQLKSALSNPVTWKGLVYLLVKFPLGVFSFIILVTFLSVSLALIAAPIYYQWVPGHVTMDFSFAAPNTVILVDTLSEALLACLVGLVFFFISLHIFNALAWVSGKFARVMLGNFRTSPALAVPATSSSEEQLTPDPSSSTESPA